ncbi:hypothetical protein DFJ58DRAFT_6125 [Suillus subalutaceus]|uniref:uncharacterized protein n=1 Tax=Suillus subalutaceus TaxID=48586 RepID=UPI001B86E87A|nr:uncharacterized protein DFJ58DRAFT_6125 [Suillus subalutaceus]KAG1877770.1 hypothetical protein DFJ58DRAFT_6125 [Suillus subalutaceus]
MDPSAPQTVAKGVLITSTVCGLTAGLYGVVKSQPPGPLLLFSALNSGIASATFFSIREYLVGPVLVLSMPGKQYELRRQILKEAAEGAPTNISKLTWGDIRSRKVLDSSISGALAGSILNTWKRGRSGTVPGLVTGATMCGLFQWAFNEFDILRITHVSKVVHTQPVPAIPAAPVATYSLPVAAPEPPKSFTDRIFAMFGRRISDEEYLNRVKAQRDNHLRRIEQLERERDEKRET